MLHSLYLCLFFFLIVGDLMDVQGFLHSPLATMRNDVLHGAMTTTTRSMATSKGDINEINELIDQNLAILYVAAETKKEDPDKVYDALQDLEKLMKKKNRSDPRMPQRTLDALSAEGKSWRLIFTTGTDKTQQRNKGKRINYFPLKATQSFNSAADPWFIENGIGVGDLSVLKFNGYFDWSAQNGNTKLTFDFTNVSLFGGLLNIPLQGGDAARLGAKTGLGSEGNVNLVEKQGKQPFFAWISADDKIATARGAGGGLALWKKIPYEGAQ